jgi:hypothetical protein
VNTRIKTTLISFSKRQKIIASTLVLTFVLVLSTQAVNFIFLRNQLIIVLVIMAYLLSLWSLWEGMTKLKAIILMILPTMFTLAAVSFYYLLPVRWLTRLPMALIFGTSFYGILLSQNVFNVAAVKTIPLYRAASTASFLFTLITGFLLFNVLLTFNLPFYLNGVVAFLITFPLCLQVFWSLDMENISSSILIYSVILSLLVGELALTLSFWPVVPTIWALLLSTSIYILLGLVTDSIKSRLTNRLVYEYIGVGGVAVVFSVLATSWVG